MGQESTDESAIGEEDVGASVHDTGGSGEIGTIEDYDDENVYVNASHDRDEEELDALGWRASDGSYAIATDSIRGLPDEEDGDHGVDLSAYEHPDDDSG